MLLHSEKSIDKETSAKGYAPGCAAEEGNTFTTAEIASCIFTADKLAKALREEASNP